MIKKLIILTLSPVWIIAAIPVLFIAACCEVYDDIQRDDP